MRSSSSAADRPPLTADREAAAAAVATLDRGRRWVFPLPMRGDWRSVDEVLASTCDTLFPDGVGRGRVTVDSRASDGDTPLHVVVWRNDAEAARLLLGAGADVNARGDMGYTPLHAAVSQGNVEMVQLLLDAGASADVTAEISGTARDEAKRAGGAMAELFAKRDA